jgi:hypothetical protein
LLVIGLLVVGARRLAHLRYVTNDPLFARLCGLSRLPSDRTVVNWLKQFTQTSLRALARLNRELLYEQIEQLKLPRLTIDLDGTVICTGAKVAWAARGFNPHHRKAPSYYPLLAHLAQTGQILRLKNRPGNVHDSKGAEVFLSQLLAELRARFGRSLPLELRWAIKSASCISAVPGHPERENHVRSLRQTRLWRACCRSRDRPCSDDSLGRKWRLALRQLARTEQGT